MIDLPPSLRSRKETTVYLGGYTSLPRTFWWGWELLDHHLDFSPLWMYDLAEHTATEQITSSMHFHYGVAGQALLDFRNVRYIIEPGQAFLIAGPESFSLAPDYDSPMGVWENLGIMISGGCQIELAQDILARNGPVFQLYDNHLAIQHLTRLISAGAANAYRTAFALSAAYHPFLLSLYQLAQTALTASRMDVTSVISLMRTQYHLPLTLKGLSEYASCSMPHLTQHFRAQTGYTPMDYLTRIRLTNAIERLMGQPALTITRAASACGFRHPITLYKVTQRYLQCTPADARKMAWQRLIRRIWTKPPFWLLEERPVHLYAQHPGHNV